LRLTLAGLLLGLSFSAYGGQTARPNLSGIWLLDKERSDLKSPPVNADQPHGAGGGGGRGARTGGSRGKGGRGGGGGGGGGGGAGGSTPRNPTTYSPMKLDLDFYQIGETADKLTIEHADPVITIKPTVKESQESSPELSYTADGKAHEAYMADGGSVQSKT